MAAENAIDTSVLLGLGLPLGEGLRVLAEIQVRRGDLAAAKATVGQLRPLLASEQATTTATWAPALLADAQGDTARALAELAEPLRQLPERHYRLGVPDPPQLAQLTELALRAGDKHAASTAAETAQYLADANPDVAPLAGVAAHARALLGRDPRLLRQAIGLLEQGKRPLATAAAIEHLATLLTDENGAEAISLLDAAHDRYARAGASRDMNRIRSALRRHGIRRRPLAARSRACASKTFATSSQPLAAMPRHSRSNLASLPRSRALPPSTRRREAWSIPSTCIFWPKISATNA